MRFIYTRTFKILFSGLVVIFIYVFLNSKGYLDYLKKSILYLPQPIIKVGLWVITPTKDFFSSISQVGHLASENSGLKERVSQLEVQITETQRIEQENQELRKELQFKSSSHFNLQPCPVLASDAGLAQTALIGCGRDDGVSQGQAVLHQGRLLGTVILVSGKTASVQFLTHPSSVIGSKVNRNGSLGLVKGNFASGLVFSSLSSDADIVKGDLVVTAGVGSAIPSGILIGEVGDIISKPNDYEKKATVIFPINPREIIFTFVVK